MDESTGEGRKKGREGGDLEHTQCFFVFLFFASFSFGGRLNKTSMLTHVSLARRGSRNGEKCAGDPKGNHEATQPHGRRR